MVICSAAVRNEYREVYMIEYLPAEINALKWMMFGEEDVLSLGLMFHVKGVT